MGIVKQVIHTFLNIIFPERCFGCGTIGFLFCEKCRQKINGPKISKFGEIEVFSAASYQNDGIKNAIKNLKYRYAKNTAEALANIIIEKIISPEILEIEDDDILVPIPLSPKRTRERGFNQAELIAKILSDKIFIKMRGDILYKTKETESQVEIKNRDERLKNLAGAFVVKDFSAVHEKTIFLIDDVCTTGATLYEASKVLRHAGAKKIIGITVARG
ncbi:MAG: ComF family protein [Candidatus Pacebacteria bacterium]|nr:ComF family protein [Candidatus Paceibacterota bacterium]